MWQAISDSIREVMHAKEDGIREIVRKRFSHQYTNRDEAPCAAIAILTFRNFFELVRFDFIIDDKLKVYLLEVSHHMHLSKSEFTFFYRLICRPICLQVTLLPINGSMNKSRPSKKDLLINCLTQLLLQILYNTLKLVGLASATAAHPADVYVSTVYILLMFFDL